MNYFLTPTGLKDTGMSVRELYDYLKEGRLWMSDDEALEFFTALVESPHVLFKEWGYEYKDMRRDYEHDELMIMVPLDHVGKGKEDADYMVIEKIASDYSGDCAKRTYIAATKLNGLLRRKILDELIPTL